MKYFITFAANHVDKNGNSLKNKFTRIEANSKEEATANAYSIFGQNWSMVYVSAEEAGVDKWNLEYIAPKDVADGPMETKMDLRKLPLPLAEAIEAVTEDEVKNVEAIRTFMNDLTRVPIVTKGAVLPDSCPAGKEQATIPVGGAIIARNAILPGCHSADICCSMMATFFQCDDSTAHILDTLQTVTRFGMAGRKIGSFVHHPVLDEKVWHNDFLKGLEQYAIMHMADQGDGNHFAYLGNVQDGAKLGEAFHDIGHHVLGDKFDDVKYRVLVTHHGSRGLGAQLYKRGMQAAIEYTNSVAQNIPTAACWLDATTLEGEEYWEALQYISRWTKGNHESIHNALLKKLGIHSNIQFGNEHNFVWKRGEDYYHGKGATPAWKGDDGLPLVGLIPLNMAAPILIVAGRDNQQYLSFAPHGAGRNMSRTQMKREFGINPTLLRETTKGLDIRWYCGTPDISESPKAYKDAKTIEKQIKQFGLADVIGHIQPEGGFMAGENNWKRNRK